MKDQARIAVASRSFSNNQMLRNEILDLYERVKFNEEGIVLNGPSLIKFLHGSERAITGLERLDEAILSALPELKVISKYGVGLDMIDMAAMTKLGMRLGWTGGVNKRSVSELVISNSIALLRQIPVASNQIVLGNWRPYIGCNLSGRTVGIIGCGHIGKDLVSLLLAFDCKILSHDIKNFPDFYAKHNVQPCSLNSVLKESDIVTLHIPFSKSTRNILNAERLRLMKPSAILINTARGGLVDEVALKLMLLEGRLAGAAFDVFDSEPPQDHELLSLPNFLVTPHIGGSSEESVLAMGRAAIRGLAENVSPGDICFEMEDL